MSKLLKTSLGFTILSALASGLNFLYYPVISHLLPLAEFGDVQIGVSFIMLAAALFTSLNTLALFSIARGQARNESLQHIERLVVTVSLAGSLLTILFAIPISHALQLKDPSLLYILAAIFIINIPAATWIGSLQGKGRFLASGGIAVAASFIKIAASTLAILMGFGAHGALAGIALGTFAILPLVKLFDGGSAKYSETFSLLKKRDIKFFSNNGGVLAILASLILFAIVSNLDVVFAKAFFDPDTAGSYAQLSTAAKIPYFVFLPVAIVLFERFIKKTIRIAPAFTFFISAVIVSGVGVWLFANPLLKLIFNHSSNFDREVFPLLLVSFVSYSILTLCVYLLIAKRRIGRLLVASSLACALATVTLLLHHSTPLAVAESFSLAITAALVLALGLQYTNKRYA